MFISKKLNEKPTHCKNCLTSQEHAYTLNDTDHFSHWVLLTASSKRKTTYVQKKNTGVKNLLTLKLLEP